MLLDFIVFSVARQVLRACRTNAAICWHLKAAGGASSGAYSSTSTRHCSLRIPDQCPDRPRCGVAARSGYSCRTGICNCSTRSALGRAGAEGKSSSSTGAGGAWGWSSGAGMECGPGCGSRGAICASAAAWRRGEDYFPSSGSGSGKARAIPST